MVYNYCITEIDRRRGRSKRDSHRVFSTYEEALQALQGYAAEHCTYYDDDSEEKPDGYYLPGWYDDASGEFCLEANSDYYTYDCGLLTLKINENLVTEEAYYAVVRTIRKEDSTLHDVCFSLNMFFSGCKDGVEAAKDLEFYRVHPALTPNYAENEIYVEYNREEGIVYRLKYRKRMFDVEFYVSEEYAHNSWQPLCANGAREIIDYSISENGFVYEVTRCEGTLSRCSGISEIRDKDLIFRDAEFDYDDIEIVGEEDKDFVLSQFIPMVGNQIPSIAYLLETFAIYKIKHNYKNDDKFILLPYENLV